VIDEDARKVKVKLKLSSQTRVFTPRMSVEKH